jgi:carnitine 3-dehydrogenase
MTLAALDPSLPLRLYESAVDPAWVDYNGHMTEARYGDLFAYATDAFLRHVGLDAVYLADGHSLYTVETHVRYLHEIAALEPVVVATQVLGSDEKRLHLFHTLEHGRDGTALATGEHLLLHVDTMEGRAGPMRDPLGAGVAAATRAHEALPRPERAGRAVGLG